MDGPDPFRLDADTPFLLDPAAQKLCAALENAGYQALFVGGCVRNAVMGLPASDIDISTDALPQGVMDLATAKGWKAVPTGIDHGTVTLVVAGTPYEVTTFRRDVATDGRRAVVAFSKDIADDAVRRDFTMNALYADRHGTLHDPLDGLQDATQRRVRFIQDPDQRIREDYLRILRFFRFSAFYADSTAGWDADTLAAIAANSDRLETLSAERVGAEMLKLFAAPDPVKALAVMDQIGVLQRILPGASITLIGPYVHLEQSVGATADPICRLAALGGVKVADRLRLSRKDQTKLADVQQYSMSQLGPKALGYLVGAAGGMGSILLRSATANEPLAPGISNQVREGARAEFPISASDLPDLSGPELGARLKALKQFWLASDLTKSKHDLLGT